ncbi:MAG: hypothetical protein FJY67_10385 [Calditrichaeota bacterium]|nr:hypothetical protein [Calditrichota bacterium]
MRNESSKRKAEIAVKGWLPAVFAVMMMLPEGALAQALRTGRSVAMAGSSPLGMYGAQAAGWNPANLGLKANPKVTMQLPSFAWSFGNNAFSPQFIMDNFQEGEVLDSTDKERILGEFDTDNLDMNLALGIPIFGFSGGRFAFNTDAHVLGRFSLPEDLFQMALTGPVKDRVYDFGTVEEAGMAYWTAGLSVGHPLPAPFPFLSEFAVGATFKYVGGIAYGELDKKDAVLQITSSTIRAEGLTRLLIGKEGGDGIGLDLAAAGKMDPGNIYLGVTLGNVIGSINWSDVEAHESQFYRNSGIHPDSLSHNEYWEHFLQQDDTTYNIGSRTTPLPKYFMISGDLPYMNGKADLFANYYQGLNDVPANSLTPKFSVGTEFRWLVVLPLRAGVSFGGLEGFELGGGFGIKLPGYQLNFGASWQRGVLAGAKGFSLAVTQSFGLGFKR